MKVLFTKAKSTSTKRIIVTADHLVKTFKITNKQRKINHTKEKTIIAVNDLSFDVYQGEIYGLLGPNGAGKTTTLRILSNLITPDSGDVIIDKVSVIKKRDEIISKIGFLTSELKLEEFFTPDYLFNFFSELHGLTKSESEKRKNELFVKFGIDKFAEVKVSNLSTGMRQKLSIAISIIHNPDIIIFDEPTNGLDVLTARAIQEYLLELKNSGKTIIISTHIFSIAEKLCDRVGIIIDGKMVCEDTISNLTKDKSLEDVFYDIYKESVQDA
ncbi:MAG: ATP-binding cassette domain-containing protein [Bacilli bacterium]